MRNHRILLTRPSCLGAGLALAALAGCQANQEPIEIDPNDPYASVPTVVEASEEAARDITEENVDQAFERLFEEINRGLGDQ